MQQEGFEVSFVHRSFQEYFCAVFVANSGAGFVKRYLDEAEFRSYDSVLPMLMGLAQQRVETEWAFDRVSELCDQFPQADPKSEIRLFLACYPEFEVVATSRGLGLVNIKQTKVSRDIHVIETFYPAEYRLAFADEDNVEEDVEFDFTSASEWERGYTEALKKLERAGKVELQGLSKALAEANSQTEERQMPRFSFRPDEDYGEFYRGLFESRVGSVVSFLHLVRSVQSERKTRANSFLGEVFGPIEV